VWCRPCQLGHPMVAFRAQSRSESASRGVGAEEILVQAIQPMPV